MIWAVKNFGNRPHMSVVSGFAELGITIIKALEQSLKYKPFNVMLQNFIKLHVQDLKS